MTERASERPLLNQRYRLVQLLGKGGMGAVYKGEDLKFQRRSVAIKEMLQSNLAPQEVRRATSMFEQEAQLLASLQHPNLPSIYDYFDEGRRWYLVMDFIEGTTLSKRLEQAPNHVLSLQQTLDIGIQLAKVLGYLHNRPSPIIFRDLKPLNIMITPDDNIYLIDFGIARLFKPGQAQDTVSYISAGYAAPEQYGTAQTSPQSDIYSLGATLHQLLSSHQPNESPFKFKSLQSYNPQIPTQLTQLVAKMVDMEPSQRPASMMVVRQSLEQVQMHMRQGASPATLSAFTKTTQSTQSARPSTQGLPNRASSRPSQSAPSAHPAISSPAPVTNSPHYTRPLSGRPPDTSQQNSPYPPPAYPGYAPYPPYPQYQPYAPYPPHSQPMYPYPTGQVQQNLTPRPFMLPKGRIRRATGMGILTGSVILGAAYLIHPIQTGTNAALLLLGCLILNGIIVGRLAIVRKIGFLSGAIAGLVIDAAPLFFQYYTNHAYHAAHLNFYTTGPFYLNLSLVMLTAGLLSLFGAWLSTIGHRYYKKA